MTTYEIGIIAVDTLSLAPKQRMARIDLFTKVVKEIFQGDVPKQHELTQIRGVINKLHIYYPTMIALHKISAKKFELYRK